MRPKTSGLTGASTTLDRVVFEGYQREKVNDHYRRIARNWDDKKFLPPIVVDLSPEGVDGFAVLDGMQRLSALSLRLKLDGYTTDDQRVDCIMLPYMDYSAREQFFLEINDPKARRAVAKSHTYKLKADRGDAFEKALQDAFADLGLSTKGNRWAFTTLHDLLAHYAPERAYSFAMTVLDVYRRTYETQAGKKARPFYGALILYLMENPNRRSPEIIRALNDTLPNTSQFQAEVLQAQAQIGRAGGDDNLEAAYQAGALVIARSVAVAEGQTNIRQLRRVS